MFLPPDDALSEAHGLAFGRVREVMIQVRCCRFRWLRMQGEKGRVGLRYRLTVHPRPMHYMCTQVHMTRHLAQGT
jgi:hypothetical protein